MLDSFGGGGSPAFEAGEFPWSYGVVTLGIFGIGFALVEAGHRLARRRRSSVVVAASRGEPTDSCPNDAQGPPERDPAGPAVVRLFGQALERRVRTTPPSTRPAPRSTSHDDAGAPVAGSAAAAGWATRAGWAGACVSSVVGGLADGFVGFSGLFGGSTGSSGISTHSPVSSSPT